MPTKIGSTKLSAKVNFLLRESKKQRQKNQCGKITSAEQNVNNYTIKIHKSNILMLGEADFSFTWAFINKCSRKGIKFGENSLYTTEIRREEQLSQKYSGFDSNISKILQFNQMHNKKKSQIKNKGSKSVKFRLGHSNTQNSMNDAMRVKWVSIVRVISNFDC